jgi:phosphoribosylglycinamide formyltransferase-1
LISSNSKAKGLIYARQKKIKRKIFKLKNKIKDENKILNQLDKSSIKLICLAGFMVILSQNFIKKFKGQILNIHPSLLPKYKGLNTHRKAIENNEKYSGCTVHLVTSKLDSGKIILQKKVKINKNDKPKTLAKKILKQEHILYPKAIKKVLSNL